MAAAELQHNPVQRQTLEVLENLWICLKVHSLLILKLASFIKFKEHKLPPTDILTAGSVAAHGLSDLNCNQTASRLNMGCNET